MRAEAGELTFKARRQLLANNFFSRIIKIEEHPIIPMWRSILKHKQRNVNYWKVEEVPYLVESYKHFFPYKNRLYKGHTLPCFEIYPEIQIQLIPQINLLIPKSNDASMMFREKTEKLIKENIFIYTDGSKKDGRPGYAVYCPTNNHSYTSR